MAEKVKSGEALFSQSNSISDEEFRRSAVGDEPALEDELGFTPYVESLKEFIIHPNTQPPLTVSVEGGWGVGKSSFMGQLKQALDHEGNVTVEFNPWRHEEEDALWAAFMLEFLEQVSSPAKFADRWLGDLKLRLFRLDWHDGEATLATKTTAGAFILVVLPLVVAALGAGLLMALGQQSVVEAVAGGMALGGLVSGSSFLGIQRLKAEAVDMYEPVLEKFITDPGYEDRVSFIEHIHDDIEHILDAYIGQDRRVFVFVDDLDRCSVPKAAELMQSIVLMLATDERLVFILGFDREKIAAAVAAKHEALFDYLDDEADPAFPLTFGYTYLEKFIQIPFLVPQPRPEDIERYLEALTEAEESATDDPGTEKFIVPGWNRDRLQEVVQYVAPAFEYNPRQIKRFLNLYRLRALLADNAGFLHDPEDHITLEQLGKFVAIGLEWPRLLAELGEDPDLLAELYEASLRRELSRILDIEATDGETRGVSDDPVESIGSIGKTSAEMVGINARLACLEARMIALGLDTHGRSRPVLPERDRERLDALLIAGLYDPDGPTLTEDLDVEDATIDQLESSTSADPDYSLAAVNVEKLLRVSPPADRPMEAMSKR